VATRPLRVVHVVTKMAIGGAQESAIATCAGLAPEFEQILLSGTEVDAEGSLLAAAQEQGVPVVFEPALVRPIAPLADLRATWRLAQQFRRRQPDIVHTHSSKAGVLGRVAARLARVPKVVHSVHGWSFNDDMSKSARALIVGVERVAARFTDALVVESSTDLPKGLSRRIGRARQYALIRNGIDLTRFIDVEVNRAEMRESLGIPVDAWLVGTVGRLADQKDPMLMVEAFAKVAANIGDGHFVWVGDGPLRAKVEARAAQLALTDRFHLVGVRRDVPNVLRALDVFALSSRWEGLPRTVTEAMASSIPVVATNVDGVAELIDHGVNGVLVSTGDANGLADALCCLHREPARAERLARSAVERSTWFSRDAMLADVGHLYSEIVSRRPVPRSRRPLRVVHVITGLGTGGAERQLAALVRASDRARIVHQVVSLTELGPVAEELATGGTRVDAVGLRLSRPDPRDVMRLRALIARSGADVVQTWLYHADLVGGLLARSLGLPVVWNVRMTWMDEVATKSSTIAAARLCARLSRRVPHQIVFNSHAGLATHEAHGYFTGRALVVQNAVDLDRFIARPDAGAGLRRLLGITEDTLLVGQVARFDPQKGHAIVLQALPAILERHPAVHVVLVGRGCSVDDEVIGSMVASSGAPERVHLLGARLDIGWITAGFDVAVSASTYGESFPNAVVEALACEVPVVATDVGAARELVGRAGRVVSPGSAKALAAAVGDILALSSEERRELGRSGRRKLTGHDVEHMAASYAALYESVASR
jgi:glycosyltransferase involved in cell wall biosynthesis